MLLNVIFSPFPQPLSFFSSCLPSLHSISFFSNPPTLGEFHGHCDLPPNPTLLPNHINLIEQVDSTEEKETKIHGAPWRCQVECKNAEYRQTSSVAHESSCEAWEPSYCYSTSVTPRPIKAEKHIPKIQGKSCFPGGANGKESAYQCRRHKRRGFDPWAGKIPWRRKWQPTPIFLPGKFHRQRSLASYSPWGCKESNMTEH